MTKPEALMNLYERLAAVCEAAEDKGMSKAEIVGALEMWKVTIMHQLISQAEESMDEIPS